MLLRGSMSVAPPPVPSYLQGTRTLERDPGGGTQLSLMGHHERAPVAISTLSYTSLGELERCGYRYYLERVLGMGEERSAARGEEGRASPDARARGTLVHGLLEDLDFSDPRVPSLEQIGARAKALGLRLAPAQRAEIIELITRALAAAPAARIAAAVRVRREHPFALTLRVEDPLIVGVIDVLAEERDGGSVVFDYKSDRVEAGVELAALVERDYEVQRLLYALATLRGGARSVEVVHWFLERPDEPVGCGYTAAELPVLEKRLAARIEAARAAAFTVSSMPHRGLCLTCPGRAGMCSWSETETLREDPLSRDAGVRGGLPQL